ncbi:MAG TPA: DUF1345 domain-containing protein [Streptosporangiaceae bacterium]|jgi:uncharacterized membrane protein
MSWRGGAPAQRKTEERGTQPPMTVPGSRMPANRVAAYAVTRVTELGLVALGAGFAFFSQTAGSDLAYLSGWDVLVVCYLAIGFAVARHRRMRPDAARPGGGLGRLLASARLSFGFTIAVSLIGILSLDSALFYGGNTAYGKEIRLSGGVAIVAAWLLLHAGYAAFYASRYYEGEALAGAADTAGVPRVRGGLEFPHCTAPMATDFLYFSFTVGTSFAVSDVNVASQAMRWHVMVHSVLAFFYNAVVLAAAIGFLTGR